MKNALIFIVILIVAGAGAYWYYYIKPQQAATGNGTATDKPKPQGDTPSWLPESFPLKKGMKGNSVKVLQAFLNKKGANLTVDGVFGADTEKAAKNILQLSEISSDKFLNLKNLVEAKAGDVNDYFVSELQENRTTELLTKLDKLANEPLIVVYNAYKQATGNSLKKDLADEITIPFTDYKAIRDKIVNRLDNLNLV